MSNTPIIVKFIDGKEVTLSEEEAKKDIAKNEKLIALNGNEFEYQRDRAEQYPSIADVVVALAEKEEGNDAMWQEITALRQKVKNPTILNQHE